MEKLQYERPVIKKMNTGLMNKFGVKNDSEPYPSIEGVSVGSLLEQYGSPLFVISEKQIRHNYRNAIRIFKTRYPKVRFAWSYKTNYLRAVCNIFHQEGSWAEVVSGFEYRKALDNGVPGSRIIFNGPAKTDDDLLVAARNNSMIHVDNLDELFTLTAISEKYSLRPRVAVRVNMDTGIYPKWDRFGFNLENGQAWSAITRIMNSGALDLVGLHCHIGTYILSASAYSAAATKLCELAMNIRNKYARTIEYIDLGGGFASSNTLKGTYLPGSAVVPSFDQYADSITTALLDGGLRQDELPFLILETGRALIDDAAWLLATVTGTKRLSDGRRATIIDAGVNILFTSLWYDHKLSPAQDCGQYTEDMAVYGPLCMNIDMIRESVSLPLLEKGNNVVIHNVGAYNMTQWMQFIMLRPNVVMIDASGKIHIVRNAETLNSVSDNESVPGHLESFGL